MNVDMLLTVRSTDSDEIGNDRILADGMAMRLGVNTALDKHACAGDWWLH